MSNWELKNLWQKGNGDIIFTVGPSFNSKEGATAFLYISLYLLALWNLWPTHGAGALILGVIYVFMYAISFVISFFINFWVALMWLVPTGIGYAACVDDDTPLIVKIPCFFLWLWGFNNIVMLWASQS